MCRNKLSFCTRIRLTCTSVCKFPRGSEASHHGKLAGGENETERAGILRPADGTALNELPRRGGKNHLGSNCQSGLYAGGKRDGQRTGRARRQPQRLPFANYPRQHTRATGKRLFTRLFRARSTAIARPMPSSCWSASKA